MRHALITFAASALGVIVALAGYRWWQQHEETLERSAIERIVQRAEAQGAALDAQSVAVQRASDAIRDDFIAASGAKVAVSESYMATGRMPATNAAAGLPEPGKYRGRSLRSLSIAEGGRLVFEFDALSGHDGGIIELVPDLGGVEALGLQWRCTTRDFPLVARALPSCDYEGDGAVGVSSPATP